MADALDLASDLRRRWAALSSDEGLGEQLIAAYSEPQRRYHALSHVAWLLDEADRRATLISDARLIGFTIWFHDAIYDPTRPDNEERSADWARVVLGEGFGDTVAALVRKTKNHADGDATPDEALFLDMDIAILGAPANVYATYAADIRAEYAHVPDALFAAGRGAFLSAWLQRPRLFRTDLYEAEFGAQARTNMAWEASQLAAKNA